MQSSWRIMTSTRKILLIAGDTPEVCVKPAKGGLLPNQALPCLASGLDLLLYSRALQERMHSLPVNFLSTPHQSIPLPPAHSQDFMVEPYIHAARWAFATAVQQSLRIKLPDRRLASAS